MILSLLNLCSWEESIQVLGQVRAIVLIEGRITVFVNEPKATGVLDLVGVIHVVPRIKPTWTGLQDFSAFGFPKDLIKQWRHARTRLVWS